MADPPKRRSVVLTILIGDLANPVNPLVRTAFLVRNIMSR